MSVLYTPRLLSEDLDELRCSAAVALEPAALVDAPAAVTQGRVWPRVLLRRNFFASLTSPLLRLKVPQTGKYENMTTSDKPVTFRGRTSSRDGAGPLVRFAERKKVTPTDQGVSYVNGHQESI